MKYRCKQCGKRVKDSKFGELCPRCFKRGYGEEVENVQR